ncbi:MAG: bifunctional 3-deoxy-7-phosphoheptulonate synthase/chorismate mutase [Bdellovibrionales bacterium]|nr:bifunctional 3-deoxy-7-phosphoheptulonate synthase/chorismate mutase [Bdellovibrionales bacterium]
MSSSDATKEREASLSGIRDQIDEIDCKLLELLAQRREQSRKAAEIKYSDNAPLRDKAREADLLARRVHEAKEQKLDSHFVTRVFHEILDDSVRYQQQFLQRKLNDGEKVGVELKKVACQGSRGSFSYLAAEQYFSRSEDPCIFESCTTYKDVIDIVERGEADFGVLPIENTTSGGINEVYDLLQKTRLLIVGEEKFRIEPSLLGLAGSSISGLRRVLSHPQLVLQCSDFLAGLPVSVENTFNAGVAIDELRRSGATDVGIIASTEAAEILGLDILKEGVANQKENFTRFLVVGRKPVKVDSRIPSKTSIVMATAQKPGALVEALQQFRENDISLTKLESRPVLGNPWEEMFYLDFEGSIEDERITHVLEEVRKHTRFLKVLGSYPSTDISRTEVPLEPLHREASEVGNGKFPRVVCSQDVQSTGAVEKKKSIPSSYKLGSREFKAEDTIIEVKGVRIGGDSFVVIGGPCSVESEDQIQICAKHLRETGGHILRGGCFKPRTSVYSFQGMGYEGLDLLVEAGRAYGFPVITEVLAVEDVHKVAEKSDMLQIGARNMQNFTLLREVGLTQRPVLLKRGMSSSIQDLLNAAEYILAAGNQQVILCERGIRTFETATRNTLDLSAVPVLRRKTHLPIIVDPSHAAGERDIIIPLVYAAKAVGAHGVMVEFHPDPENALSDGPQALLFDQFSDMMQAIL